MFFSSFKGFICSYGMIYKKNIPHHGFDNIEIKIIFFWQTLQYGRILSVIKSWTAAIFVENGPFFKDQNYLKSDMEEGSNNINKN